MTARDPVDRRLASYGSLAPGRVNHRQLAGPNGSWRQGTVKGRLVEAGWGAGYRGVVASVHTPDGDVEAWVYVVTADPR